MIESDCSLASPESTSSEYPLTLRQFLERAQQSGLLENLSPRERLVIVEHWQKDHTLQEIASDIHVGTRERVRQIEASAFKKILLCLPETQRTIMLMLLDHEGGASQAMRRRWQDPVFRERMRKIARVRGQEPRYKEELRKKMERRWQDSLYREMMRQRNNDPRVREKRRERMLRQWQDPIYREKMSQIRSQMMKKKWQDPLYRQRRILAHRERLERKKVS